MDQVDDIYFRDWIIKNSQEVLEGYSEGITIRQLHYRLVARGMINDVLHYKRVVSAMAVARWDHIVDMKDFVDRERSVSGSTKADEKILEDEIEDAKDQIKAWMEHYGLNKWSNQEFFVEVWIEKKALQGVFEMPCFMRDVALAPCKGYPSITFLDLARDRFDHAINNGQKVVILYFGDYDPSGADIPRSIKATLNRMGVDLEVIRVSLTPEQIREHNLPGVPPKKTDSRSNSWTGGDVVELDALDPDILKAMVKESIDGYLDDAKYKVLKDREHDERIRYRQALKEYVDSLGDEMDDDSDEDDDEEA